MFIYRVVDSPKREDEAIMVYFTWRQGEGADSLTPPAKDNWWFIGAQSGVRVIST